jgi:hypothetical protein
VESDVGCDNVTLTSWDEDIWFCETDRRVGKDMAEGAEIASALAARSMVLLTSVAVGL